MEPSRKGNGHQVQFEYRIIQQQNVFFLLELKLTKISRSFPYECVFKTLLIFDYELTKMQFRYISIFASATSFKRKPYDRILA